MGDYTNYFKLFAFNASSWIATIISIGVVKDLMQIVCLLASFAVSLASIWWIRKQANAFDKEHKE